MSLDILYALVGSVAALFVSAGIVTALWRMI